MYNDRALLTIMNRNRKNDLVCMADRLDFLAGILAMNGGFLQRTGLAGGKLGIALFFYHYAQYSGNKYYDELAGSLLDDLSDQINFSAPLDFENGLTGIGWGISYLLRKGFIEGDIDEILEEIDIAISGRLNDFLPSEQINQEKVFGYNYYRQARNKSNHWDGSEIFSFINPPACDELHLTIPFLINPDNYGLFYGIAGKAFTILSSLTLKKQSQ